MKLLNLLNINKVIHMKLPKEFLTTFRLYPFLTWLLSNHARLLSPESFQD